MRTFQQFLENANPLFNALMALRPKMAQAANAIYNSWEQDEEGMDDELGGGGICDQISNEISTVCSSIPNAEITEGGQPGDDHSWLIVYTDKEAYGVDIPCHIYERGGGYSWQKIQGVTIKPADVHIFVVEKPDSEY